MSHSRKLIYCKASNFVYSFLITLFVIVLFSLLNTCLPAGRLTPRPNVLSDQNKTVKVVARVGGIGKISSLTGWTSPYAEVMLSSIGVERITTADETGFFIFNSIYLPENPGELCLISQDVNQLPSFPLCLAPPTKNVDVEIKNVLLSPTLSLDNETIPNGRTVKASGMTFPRSKVHVYLFIENSLSFWEKIVYAADFPLYEIISNENGYFEFSLPSNSPSQNKVFVASTFETEGGSPKSNTLSFRIIGFGELIKEFLQNLFSKMVTLIKSFPLSINDPLNIIVIEILILIGILAAIIIRKEKQKKLSEIDRYCLRNRNTLNRGLQFGPAGNRRRNIV